MSNATYFERWWDNREWANDQEEVAAFARDMVVSGFMLTAEGVVEYLEKPWHWSREHDWWVANGRPDSGEIWDHGIDTDFEVTE